MRRRQLLVGLSFAVFGSPISTPAQQAGKVWRIGYLSIRPGPGDTTEAFRRGLRDLGYVEGQNVVIEYRWAKDEHQRLPALAAELVRLQVDVIAAMDSLAIAAAHNATRTIPIVMWTTADPIQAGFVQSLARPAGNVTGQADFASLSGKQLELLKEVAPQLTKVAVLRNPTSPQAAAHWRETQEAARALGLQLQLVDVSGPDDFEGAFSAIDKGRNHALTILVNVRFNVHAQRLADLAAKNKLPSIYRRREFVEAGGLMSYGTNIRDSIRRAPVYVDKIFKGAKPADLPVEQPTQFELVINLKTAKALGLTIPPSLLLRADQVIE